MAPDAHAFVCPQTTTREGLRRRMLCVSGGSSAMLLRRRCAHLLRIPPCCPADDAVYRDLLRLLVLIHGPCYHIPNRQRRCNAFPRPLCSLLRRVPWIGLRALHVSRIILVQFPLPMPSLLYCSVGLTNSMKYPEFFVFVYDQVAVCIGVRGFE